MWETRPRKRILYQMSRSWYFIYMRIWKLFPCRWKLLSRLNIQFLHKFSITMFVRIKELRLSKKKKSYFSNIGRTNRLPGITVNIPRHATRAISINFTFILLLLIVLKAQLIYTQTIPKHKEVPQVTEKNRAHLH